MSKHTPGPYVMGEAGLILTDSPDRNIRFVANVRRHGSGAYGSPEMNKEDIATGILLAAAPELLEALIYVRRFITDDQCDLQYIDAAISKATKGTS